MRLSRDEVVSTWPRIFLEIQYCSNASYKGVVIQIKQENCTLSRQLSKRSFWRYVVANLDANDAAAMPVYCRLA